MSAAALLVLMLLSGTAAAGATPLPASDRQFIDGLVNRARQSQRLPGVLVYVSGPSGAYARGYGLADVARRTPMAVAMHVRIGSITQEFTATAILQQVAHGHLSLSSKLSRWVPGIRFGRRITIADLLQMRSGVYDYTTSRAFRRALARGAPGAFTPADAVAIIRREKPRFVPGSRTMFDNSDYVLLGMVLARVAGRSAESVINHEVVRAAGLRGTRFPADDGLPHPFAHGYSSASGASGRLRDITRLDPKLMWTAGAMFSTPRDLARWTAALASGELLPAGLRQRQLQSARTAIANHAGLAYGLGITRYGDWLGGVGAIVGFNSAAFYSPFVGASIVVVTNRSSNSSSRALGIFAQIAKRLYTPSAPADQSRPQLFGTTRSGQVLAASPGTWTGMPPPAFSYAWQRCDPSGASCQTIAGAHGSSYSLTGADVGARLRVLVSARNGVGSAAAASPLSDVVGLPRDPLIAAAGDIACTPGDTTDACRQQATATLVAAQHPDRVFALGDTQYESGLLSEYKGTGAYNATWGVFNPIVNPVPGNHEYDASSSASGYFTYFGSRAHPPNGSYSFDLGSWHIVALNSDCSDSRTPACIDDIGGDTTAAQTAWLKSDLAANRSECVLALWHHPRFSQGFVGDSPKVGPLWSALYARHADVVLNGHDHMYERFALQDPSGALASGGIREFVAGTGGESLFAISTTEPHAQLTDNTHFGALVLTLHGSSYSWAFRRTPDGAVLDSGTTSCHGPGPSLLSGRGARLDEGAPVPPRFAFSARVARVRLHSASRVGLPVTVHCSRGCDVVVDAWRRVQGHVRRIASFRQTESEIPRANSRIVLRLPNLRSLGGGRQTLILRFDAVDAAGTRRVVVRTVRMR